MLIKKREKNSLFALSNNRANDGGFFKFKIQRFIHLRHQLNCFNNNKLNTNLANKNLKIAEKHSNSSIIIQILNRKRKAKNGFFGLIYSLGFARENEKMWGFFFIFILSFLDDLHFWLANFPLFAFLFFLLLVVIFEISRF